MIGGVIPMTVTNSLVGDKRLLVERLELHPPTAFLLQFAVCDPEIEAHRWLTMVEDEERYQVAREEAALPKELPKNDDDHRVIGWHIGLVDWEQKVRRDGTVMVPWRARIVVGSTRQSRMNVVVEE